MLQFFVKAAYAQGIDKGIDIGNTFGPTSGGPQSFRTLGGLISVLLPNILTIAGVVAFIGVVIAGFNVIHHAGSGEAEKASKDKQAFTAALIGLIIVFGAYFLIQIVGTLVGYNFLSPKL